MSFSVNFTSPNLLQPVTQMVSPASVPFHSQSVYPCNAGSSFYSSPLGHTRPGAAASTCHETSNSHVKRKGGRRPKDDSVSDGVMALDSPLCLQWAACQRKKNVLWKKCWFSDWREALKYAVSPSYRALSIPTPARSTVWFFFSISYFRSFGLSLPLATSPSCCTYDGHCCSSAIMCVLYTYHI